MTKAAMLKEIRDNGYWASLLDVSEKSSYEEVKDAYEIMINETSSDIDMFPNGHDEDDDY